MDIITRDCLWIIVAALLGYAYKYVVNNYNDVTLFELLYYIKVPMKGANAGPFTKEIPGILTTVAVATAMVQLTDRFFLEPGFWSFFGKLLIVFIIVILFSHFHVLKFIYLSFKTSNIYEENYIDPKEVELVFPEKKRNLIYIFMESMETCYSKKQNGHTEYIKELAEYAQEGHDFSIEGENEINGAYAVPGATYTTGAMLSHLSGVPISSMFPSNLTGKKKFLPNLTILGDILEKEGYNQEFVLGSDIDFGGRKPLMADHGHQKIFDFIEAKKTGRIPKDYRVFWGMEDEKLFENAKLEITELAKKDEPFAMTLLTVDTHFLDGYKCRLCPDTFDTQYGNAIACSSKQVYDFVEWAKTQEWYENTTIVLAGDHPTMDSGFIDKAKLKGNDRKSFVSYLNVPENLTEYVHDYTSLDLFPTTLAGLGVEIAGNHLGLGVNLFSREETLIEKLGEKKLEEELTMRSKYYKKFL